MKIILLSNHTYTRNTEQVSVFITVDSWPEESSWNIYDYANQTYYYSSNQTFPTDDNVTYEQTVDLEIGLYSIDVWDTYGDSGLSGMFTMQVMKLLYPGLALIMQVLENLIFCWWYSNFRMY